MRHLISTSRRLGQPWRQTRRWLSWSPGAGLNWQTLDPWGRGSCWQRSCQGRERRRETLWFPLSSCLPTGQTEQRPVDVKPGNFSLQDQLPWEETVQLQFSCSVVSDSLRTHGLQCAKPPCLLPTPGVYSNPCSFISDVIQPSHPLTSPSPPTFNLSQDQGLL